MNSAWGSEKENPLEADLESWIANYGDGLLRMCILELGDYSLAEDAVQETYIRAFRSYAKFEHRCAVKTWLTTIAINVCRSMRRSAWHRHVISLEKFPDIPVAGTEEISDYSVSQAVMKLPPDLREVILLHELQGLKLREIAEIRHLPLATIASRLNRAKQRLRKELKEWYDEA